MKVIQLRWTDEMTWKTIESAEADTEAQIARLKASWEKSRAKNKLKHDAEFRVFDTDLAEALKLILKDCAEPVKRHTYDPDEAYELGRQAAKAELAQQIRELINA